MREDNTKLALSTHPDLTPAELDYLIRASAPQAQVAQSVEQRTENPRVGGSIPPLGTIFIKSITYVSYRILTHFTILVI